MIVVSDTSPISHLHQIGRLSLLKDLYGEVIIPPAVERELRGARAIHQELDSTLLRVIVPLNAAKVAELLKVLDQGESEAIVLATEIGADLLLIDEATRRDVARQYGLRRTGLLGVLLDAKRHGFVSELAEVIRLLTSKTSFRISRQVQAEVLRLAGEVA